ncbi:unnamed protein product [Ranitomeya imitator]|uniref:TNase-like domain-containing protein n=1 Tax=Ranitomeya imitator TaxID=111125 RepID=A0ABN9LFC3_9NEOB|nr:unnamed protein product [Ranitomeya imitator]
MRMMSKMILREKDCQRFPGASTASKAMQVRRWGGFMNDCLNVVVLKEGLGRTAHIRGAHQGPGQHLAFYKRLLQAEIKALKGQKGLWKEESQQSTLTDKILNVRFIQHMKQFISLMAKYWKKWKP